MTQFIRSDNNRRQNQAQGSSIMTSHVFQPFLTYLPCPTLYHPILGLSWTHLPTIISDIINGCSPRGLKKAKRSQSEPYYRNISQLQQSQTTFIYLLVLDYIKTEQLLQSLLTLKQSKKLKTIKTMINILGKPFPAWYLPSPSCLFPK